MSLLEYALQYAERGLEVFPLKPDKTPYTINGMKDATTDVDVIRRSFSAHANALIGHRVATDQVILDLDKRHGGLETWRALTREHDVIPATRTHFSGRNDGGSHRWFLRAAGKLSTRKLDDWAKAHGVGAPKGRHSWTAGIDLLHHNHRYSILPPSPHAATGQPYRWLPQCGLEMAPVTLPIWLADLLTVDPIEEVSNYVSDTPTDEDSIADWFASSVRWSELLPRYGWRVVAGDGDSDDSRWRHPTAESSWSATIRHGTLFVYSTSTDFDCTEDDKPRGYTKFRAFAVLEGCGMPEAARRLRLQKDGPLKTHQELLAEIVPDLVNQRAHRDESADDPEQRKPPAGLIPIDWEEFWSRERKEPQWLIYPIVPEARQVALFAGAKTGKSELVLAGAAAAASGRPVYGQPAKDPIDIVYVDKEMTQDDVRDRLMELGYNATVDLTALHYYDLPSLPPLDRKEGGAIILELALFHQARLVIIDTLSRVTEGGENDADTYRGFYQHTGELLKAQGIALLRLDHSGKDSARGQRGSSGKNDDVDIVWHLTRGPDDTSKLSRTHSRINWGEPEAIFKREADDVNEMLHYELVVVEDESYPAGTQIVVDELDTLNVPSSATVDEALSALRAANKGKRRKIVNAAMRCRRQRDDIANRRRNSRELGGNCEVIHRAELDRELTGTTYSDLRELGRELPGTGTGSHTGTVVPPIGGTTSPDRPCETGEVTVDDLY